MGAKKILAGRGRGDTEKVQYYKILEKVVEKEKRLKKE